MTSGALVIVTDDDGRRYWSHTRFDVFSMPSSASGLLRGPDLVMLDGIAGGYLVSRVREAGPLEVANLPHFRDRAAVRRGEVVPLEATEGGANRVLVTPEELRAVARLVVELDARARGEV